MQGPHAAQHRRRLGLPVPDQQVLPRQAVRERDRPRRSPTRSRRRRTGSTRTSSTASSTPSARAAARTGDVALQVRRPGSRRRRRQRQRRGGPRCRRRTAPDAVGPDQPVRVIAVRSRSRRRARPRHRQHVVQGATGTWKSSRDHNWMLSVGTFLPIAGVLLHAVHPAARTSCCSSRSRCGTALATLGVGVYTLIAVRLRPGGEAAVLREHRVDRGHQERLHDRARRDQPPAVLPVDGHHGAGDDLLVGPHPRAGEPEGVLHPDARPADRHGRHVHRRGPDPVLRLLRGRPAADVLHDRRVGRRAAPVRIAEVLHLHDVRVGADAGVVPRGLLPDGLARASRSRTSSRTGRASRATSRSGSSPACSSASR